MLKRSRLHIKKMLSKQLQENGKGLMISASSVGIASAPKYASSKSFPCNAHRRAIEDAPVFT